MIPTITPMIAVIDVITPKTIPMISPLLSASPLSARMTTQRKGVQCTCNDLLAIT